MATTGPGAAHRHKTKSGYWYDQTDVASGSTHTHTFAEHPADSLTEAEVTALKSLLVAPAPTPTPPPPPAPPPPTPTPTPPITGSLQAAIDAATPGATLNLGTGTFGTVDIKKAIRLVGGTLAGPVGQTLANINADGVIFDGTAFSGGGTVVRIWGRTGTQFLRTRFRGSNETPIRLHLRNGITCADVLVDGADILHDGAPANGKGYSSMSAERPATGKHRNVIIRNSLIDQGVYGWGGIEVWDTDGLVIERNRFRGRHGVGADISAHISIPRSNGARIEGNDFDFGQGIGWGMEIVEQNDCIIRGNKAYGVPGQRSGHAFVQLHGGGNPAVPSTHQFYRHIIQQNEVRDLLTFVNQAGWDHVITDNCLVNVTNVYRQYGNPGGRITLARNGPLEGPCKP